MSTYKIRDIDPRLILVTDSREVAAVFEAIGLRPDDDYGLLLVDVQDGGYTEVWGSYGTVPALNKPIYRIL